MKSHLRGQNVLIYRLGSLGDTVIALPCFHAIRRAYPEAIITLLTNRPVAAKAAPLEAVLRRGVFFDEILSYPVGTRSIIQLSQLALEIRRRKISTMVYLAAARGHKALTRDRRFFRLAGITKIIGAPVGEDDFSVSRDSVTGLFESEAKRLARRMEALGQINLDAAENWNLELSAEERATAAVCLEGFGCRPFFAISIGTKAHTKDWENANWHQLLGRLADRLPDFGLLLLGAAEERKRSTELAADWKGPQVNLCGKVSPRVSAAAVSGASVFIGHDSGPLHLASCVGVPCVAVYSGINLPGQWFPYGGRNHIIYHQTDCFGCGLAVCEMQQKRCILSITVDEVEQAVFKILDRARPT